MAQLQVRFGDRVTTTLHRGDRGIFDVLVDGRKVFSKDETGRFPRRGEVEALVASLLAARSP